MTKTDALKGIIRNSDRFQKMIEDGEANKEHAEGYACYCKAVAELALKQERQHGLQ